MLDANDEHDEELAVCGATPTEARAKLRARRAAATIDLFGCGLTALPEASVFATVRTLRLASNAVAAVGALFPALASAACLEALDVSSNALAGDLAGDAVVPPLLRLREVSVAFNRLTSLRGAHTLAPRLETLDARSNRLADAAAVAGGASAVFLPPSLRSLRLRNNPLRDADALLSRVAANLDIDTARDERSAVRRRASSSPPRDVVVPWDDDDDSDDDSDDDDDFDDTRGGTSSSKGGPKRAAKRKAPQSTTWLVVEARAPPGCEPGDVVEVRLPGGGSVWTRCPASSRRKFRVLVSSAPDVEPDATVTLERELESSSDESQRGADVSSYGGSSFYDAPTHFGLPPLHGDFDDVVDSLGGEENAGFFFPPMMSSSDHDAHEELTSSMRRRRLLQRQGSSLFAAAQQHHQRLSTMPPLRSVLTDESRAPYVLDYLSRDAAALNLALVVLECDEHLKICAQSTSEKAALRRLADHERSIWDTYVKRAAPKPIFLAGDSSSSAAAAAAAAELSSSSSPHAAASMRKTSSLTTTT